MGLFKVDSCPQSCTAAVGRRRQGPLPPRSVGLGDLLLPPAALIEVAGPPYVFPRRVTDSRYGPGSPESLLKTLPASPVGRVSTSDPMLW